MSAETKVILKQSIKLSELIDYLNTIDNCKVIVRSKIGTDFKGCKTAFIRLSYNGIVRSLFWMNRKVRNTVYKKSGDKEDITSNTYLSLYCNENAIELLTEIAKHYGGYFNENDCGDNEYVEV